MSQNERKQLHAELVRQIKETSDIMEELQQFVLEKTSVLHDITENMKLIRDEFRGDIDPELFDSTSYNKNLNRIIINDFYLEKIKSIINKVNKNILLSYESIDEDFQKNFDGDLNISKIPSPDKIKTLILMARKELGLTKGLKTSKFKIFYLDDKKELIYWHDITRREFLSEFGLKNIFARALEHGAIYIGFKFIESSHGLPNVSDYEKIKKCFIFASTVREDLYEQALFINEM